MTKHSKPARDLHTEITNKFIAALEAGTRPWEKCWAGGMPTRVTGEAYRGINALILGCVGMEHGFVSPHWMTFNQAKELGGMVRKGERSSPVVFYKQFKVDAGEGERADENGERTARVLRGYNVFNVDQIDGLPEGKFTAARDADNGLARDEEAEAALRSCGARIVEGGGMACYRRDNDTVHLPEFKRFADVGSYLATMAHELCHWTGAPHRLDRTKGQTFGDRAYAFEELVAEIGAAFVCGRIGVDGENFDNHAAYVASWLKALRDDKKLIFKAAALAQSAADMVLANAGRGALKIAA